MPSDIRFYLRFDARCWRIGPEKREVEGDAFVKRPARGLENAPFDLVADAVGIDRLAAIHSGSGTHQADAAAPMLEADLDGNRRIGAEILIPRKGEAAPTPLPSAENATSRKRSAAAVMASRARGSSR